MISMLIFKFGSNFISSRKFGQGVENETHFSPSRTGKCEYFEKFHLVFIEGIHFCWNVGVKI